MPHDVRRNAKQANYLSAIAWVIIQLLQIISSSPAALTSAPRRFNASRPFDCIFFEVLTPIMGRQVLLYLSHFFKRVQELLTSTGRDDAEDSFSPLAILAVVVLSLYIAGGLGIFAKTHYWDHLTEAQKTVVIQSMAATEQTL